MASSTGQFLSRKDHLKQKELDEARKAGTLPAELDEEGREINPHIPEFMAKAPWYLNQAAPGLKHQKNSKQKEEVAGIDQWYVRGQKKTAATKFRKGACPNCGAMTHGIKDCLDRPRKKGAKWTGADIKPDEYTGGPLTFDYEGKRDRFAGFDHTAYEAMVGKKFELEEQARKEYLHVQKLQQVEHQASKMGQAAEGVEEEDDGVRVRDEETVVAAKEGGGTRQGALRMTVRNLRIREDTAKYLLNLDVNSAYYDPKTRSMRENPRPDLVPDGEDGGVFAGDNFVRYNGDTLDLRALEGYTREAYEKGQEMHLNAEPTQVELMNKIYREKKAKLKEVKANSVLEKYGGEQHLKAPDARLLFAQTEAYTEYDRSGRPRDGDAHAAKVKARSRYDEDVFTHNHTAVWGSYFDRATRRWGYADDHSTQRNSYSTGEAGKRARELAAQSIAAGMDGPSRAEVLAKEAAAAGEEGQSKGRSASEPVKSMYGIGEALADRALDKEGIRKALERERKRQRDGGDKGDAEGAKRGGYNSMREETVTAEDMEAYYMSKRRTDDPMANMPDTVDDES
mmetsp:Transcript_26005/g.70372  ORF Transcript_26005/g.70372 Transcript_26005/m.70372 type:complete len:567 (+) Transcript_26005:77-1777(+)